MDTTEHTEHVAVTPIRGRFDLRMLSLVLVVIGTLVSAYLTYVHLADTSAVCIGTDGFDCGLVQSSVYSKLLGIPIAYLGLATYLFLGALLLLENRIAILQDYGTVMIFGITLFAFLFSVWLVYVQAVLLQAFCQWCLTHEATMTVLFIVSGIRLKRALSD